MSNKGDENQKPLMYIVQPSYDESAPAMQNIVRKRKKSEKPSETKKSAKEDAIEESVQEPVSQEVKQKKEEPPALQQEREINLEKDNSQNREPVQEQEQQPEGVFHEIKEEPRRKRVKKPLSQMNIEEKVDFLTSLPHNMPRALCLIEADGKTYRGIIMERKDNMVVIRTAGGGNPVELAIGDISSIHPLGF
ncbi:CotO family spore coat protein [Bacillus altitudinis]|uniref:CotO family spore coat protein n=1 Tax=Bacillus TaxID=1386 RepID=UPI002ACD2C66|nr:CotO family spore coat protein [Bacillus altitudinis]WQH40045.1 CotO family spore coat protein [Bacillus altitudinis]